MTEGERSVARSTLVLDPTRTTDLLAESPSGRNVLAVLDGTTTGEWRQRWHREVGWEPAQMGVVETYGLTRGSAAAAAPQTRIVDEDLAVTTVQRPVHPETLVETLTEYLQGWHGGQAETTVYLETLGVCAADGDPAPLLEVLPSLLETVGEVDGLLFAGLDDETTSARDILRAREQFEAVEGEPLLDAAVEADIQRLRGDDPTTFGYLRRHWREAMRSIEETGRTYPQAKQLHATLEEPETTPRTLGAALKGLETLGVMDLWGDTVGPNRYDLRSYDPERHAAVGLTIERHLD